MRRGEVISFLMLALVLFVAGLAWLFGPLVLLGIGCVLFILMLFVDIKE